MNNLDFDHQDVGQRVELEKSKRGMALNSCYLEAKPGAGVSDVTYVKFETVMRL